MYVLQAARHPLPFSFTFKFSGDIFCCFRFSFFFFLIELMEGGNFCYRHSGSMLAT